MNKPRVKRKECSASIGYEIRNVGHDVVGVALAHYVEVPMSVPTIKNLCQSAEPRDGFFVVGSGSNCLGCNGYGSTHDDEKPGYHISKEATT
jgi:hypothetical protein